MGRTHGRKRNEKSNPFWSGNLKARDHLHDLDVDGRILNDSKQRWNEGMDWLKIGFRG